MQHDDQRNEQVYMNRSDWEKAFQKQIPRLRIYARALVKNREQADDLVQDCLERAWLHIDKWQPGSNLRAWLFTVMHNVYINHMRKHKRKPGFVSWDDSGSPSSSFEDEPTALRDLEVALGALSPEHKEVLLLAGLEQMSYAEIAEILAIPTGTVMSRLSRAREQLRMSMSGVIEKPNLRRVK